MLCLVSESKVCRYPCSLHQPRHRNPAQHPLLEQQTHCSLGHFQTSNRDCTGTLHVYIVIQCDINVYRPSKPPAPPPAPWPGPTAPPAPPGTLPGQASEDTSVELNHDRRSVVQYILCHT